MRPRHRSADEAPAAHHPGAMTARRALHALGVLAVFALGAGGALADLPSHGFALFGDLKYGPDFRHFDYVNPDAPKGGELRLHVSADTFDSLNPFILKGIRATLMLKDENYSFLGGTFDSLLYKAQDEDYGYYGLIAESVELAADRGAVVFTLRPEARFHDGTPVTAEDVRFSFEMLKTKGHPTYRTLLREVENAEVLSERRVRFTFANPDNRKLPVQVGTMPIMSRAYYSANDFTQTTLTAPLGNGPYRVARVAQGRTLVYERVGDYWGRDLAVNRGRNNFDRIVVDYYRDREIAVEAFKANEYDYHEEFTAKTWATAYEMDALAKGIVVKTVLPDHRPAPTQAYFINSRLPKFSDARVRAALDYAFDYEWTNTVIFHDAYRRTDSIFPNSPLAASEPPGARELALLEPHRERLPKEVFTTPYVSPRTDGTGRDRKNLRVARRLLEDAGWVVRQGKLVHGESGQPLEITFLIVLPTFERVIAPMAQNLERLGIKTSIRRVDAAEYIKRTERFDFEITTRAFGQTLAPGDELNALFGAASADTDGGLNLAGIKDPVVDALIERIVAAQDRETLIAAARALDRVIMWNHYLIPHWHSGTHRVIYWDKFGRPETRPKYTVGIDTWWIDPEKEARIARYRSSGGR